MNKLHRIVFKAFILGFFFLGTIGYGQKHSKEYKETFNAGQETVVNINTSYADIEFETWNKNQIVVEAVISLEGATEEEAEAYFSKDVVEILGNSKEVKISTAGNKEFFFANHHGDMQHMTIEIPDLEPLFLDLQIPDIPEIIMDMPMPPMPPMKFRNFDYEAYQREGEAYLKEWTKDFEKNFDKEYEKEIEAWGQEMEKRVEEREKAREEMMRQREEMREEREEIRQEMQEARAEAQEERRRIREEQRKAAREYQKAQRESNSWVGEEVGPNVFYGSADGKKRNYKVKKVIRVKMPKSAKLKMNVRHGEVKLAENTNNINATLSYARLLASTIDGDKTSIVASYSPIAVKSWNFGELVTNYSEGVELNEVRSLTLHSNSSDITIDRFYNNALIHSDFGALKIKDIDQNFKELTISLKNAELECFLPNTDFEIGISGNDSTLKKPNTLNLINHEDGKTFSYSNNSSSSKQITIDSMYSEIVLQE